MVTHLSTWWGRGREIHVQFPPPPQLHSELKAALGYKRLSQKAGGGGIQSKTTLQSLTNYEVCIPCSESQDQIPTLPLPSQSCHRQQRLALPVPADVIVSPGYQLENQAHLCLWGGHIKSYFFKQEGFLRVSVGNCFSCLPRFLVLLVTLFLCAKLCHV